MQKIISMSARLECPPSKAFKMFTDNRLLESWLTKLADVEPKLGGKYELYWNLEDKENDNTVGCKIIAMEKDRLIAFEWKGPKIYKHFMDDVDPLTHVVVFFEKVAGKAGGTATEVRLMHLGWRSGAEWEEARVWFEKAWRQAFDNLVKLASA